MKQQEPNHKRGQNEKKKSEHCLTSFELQSSVSTGSHLLLYDFLRQRDGKISVVPFEIFSCVMPTRAEYCQTTKAITPSCSSSHTPADPGPAFDDERETRWGLPPNARLSCFIPYPTPPALYDWIHLVKCHPAPTSEGHIIFITPPLMMLHGDSLLTMGFLSARYH